MTTYATPSELAEVYRQTGSRYMRQAELEFQQGDLLQASEKAWGAATQHLKALAVLRGLPHESHRELRIAVNHIFSETDQRRIYELFAVGEGMHANFYEAWMPEEAVSAGIQNMKELIGIFEVVPPPNGSSPGCPPRSRLFFRDRGDNP